MNKRAIGVFVAAAGALATGCTYPEKEFQGPFTCLGAPEPSTAEPLVTLQGQVVNPSDLAPLAGMSISMLDQNLGTIDGPVVTDATGGFEFALNTVGKPVKRVYLHVTGSGRVTTYYAPPRPIAEDFVLETPPGLGVLSTQQRDSLALGALGAPFMPGTGAVLFTIADCNNKPLAGASVVSDPPGAVRYFDGVIPSMTATSTDVGGVAMVANLPANQMASLTVTVDGKTFPARSFQIPADSFVQTVLLP